VCAGDVVVGVGMLALVVYYVATRGVFQGKYSGDGLFGFEYLRAIVFEHTLDMKRVVPEWLPFFNQDPVTHHMPNRCPFGPVLVWMPFYLVGVALLPLFRACGWVGGSVKTAAFTATVKPAAAFLAWFAGLGTLVAVLVGYRQTFVLLERRLGRDAARLGATVAVWATPIAWYAVTQPMYQHGCAFGCAALLVERWDATLGQTGWRRFVLLGVLGGLAMSMRAQEVLFLALPAGEIAWHLFKGPERRRWLVGGVVLGAATLVAFAPQLLVWHYYTGRFAPPQIEPLRWNEPMLVVALFSTRAGLFPWTPIAYAAALGIAVARKARVLALGLLGVFLVDLYVVACAWVLSGGYGYGARRLSDGALLIGLGVALLYDRVGARGRRLVVAFGAFSVALCLFTMEMQRAHGVPSSGGYARTAARYLEQAGAPKPLRHVFDHIGYPFVQPAGWLFALAHHVPVTAFEGVVGNFQLDRDGQWFSLLPDGKSLPFDDFHRPYLVDGLAVEAKQARVTGRGRMLLPMFAKERVGVKVVGAIPAGELHARWNGREVPIQRIADGATLDAPHEVVNAGVNELELDVPVGATLQKLEFVSTERWWSQ
jgi:hypothetical protein